MRARVISVTPAVAQEYLERNTGNRRIRPTVVRRYAKMMEDGDWHLTTDAITFDTNNRLVQGQHRLEAVIMSGKTQKFLVAYDMSPEAVRYMDRGQQRTLADAAHYDGFDRDAKFFGIAKQMYMGTKHPQITDAIILDFAMENAEAIDKVLEWVGNDGKGILTASVLAAIARATYYIDDAVLKEFTRILATGETIERGRQRCHDVQLNVIRFRNAIPGIKKSAYSGGGTVKKVLYLKTEKAIDDFDSNVEVKNILASQEELFAMDHEEAETGELVEA